MALQIDDEVDRLYEELCLEVEAVQLEQMALLRCLINHHGLRRIFCEGLTEKDLPSYKERIGVLRTVEKEQMPQLQNGIARSCRGYIEPALHSFGESSREGLQIHRPQRSNEHVADAVT